MRQLTQPNPTQLRDVTFYDVLLPIIPSERLLDRRTELHINFDLVHINDTATATEKVGVLLLDQIPWEKVCVQC